MLKSEKSEFFFKRQANIGQDEDFEAARAKATNLGAKKVRGSYCQTMYFMYTIVTLYILTYGTVYQICHFPR